MLLRLLMVAMSLGWGSEALWAGPCVGGGTERSKGSLEWMHPRKNSVRSSWVVASAAATLCEGVCMAASRSKVVLGLGRGGRVLERWQLSKNSANESCVAASANVVCASRRSS